MIDIKCNAEIKLVNISGTFKHVLIIDHITGMGNTEIGILIPEGQGINIKSIEMMAALLNKNLDFMRG